MRMGTMPHEKTERNAELYRLNREEGISYNQLAKKYDLTVQRIAQLIRNHKKKLEKENE